MAWILGSTTLPSPQGFGRNTLEQSTMHEAINGTSKKDISSRKEEFTLIFTRLTQAVVANILAEFELKQSLLFSVDDGDLVIAETNVHVKIPQREYNTKGSEYREDITLILTEVS